MTAWVRSLTASLRRMEVMWFFTVWSEMLRMRAISLLELPRAMQSRISTSRVVRGAKTDSPPSDSAEASSRNWLSMGGAARGRGGAGGAGEDVVVDGVVALADLADDVEEVVGGYVFSGVGRGADFGGVEELLVVLV